MAMIREGRNDAALSASIVEDMAQQRFLLPPDESIAERSYARISERIHPSVKHRTLSVQWWIAAASVVLLISVGIYFWPQPLRQGHTIAQAAPILPAGKAVLTLGDGTKVTLDDSGVVKLIQPGISQQGTELQYSGDAAVALNTLSVSRGKQFRVVLPDGTKAWLNAESSLKYPTVFKGRERVVEVTGEVYFEVAANASKPFSVKVSNTTIEVLGTSFNINAYTNEVDVRTTLLEGSVRIAGITLKPGEQLAGRQLIRNINTEKIMAWKNGLFNFEDASLAEVMRQLERWYDVDVVYPDGVPEVYFMGKLGRNMPLQSIIEALKDTGIKFRLEGRKLTVLPEGNSNRKK